MRNATRARKPGRWAAYLLAAFAVLAPQLLGGATEGTQLAITTAGALAALCCALAFRDSITPLGSVPLAVVAALVAAFWTLVQALPLPCSWTAWAQPERTTLAATLVDLGMFESAGCNLSLAPGSTWTTLSLATTLVAVLVSATVVARAGHRRTLLVAIAMSSAVMACVALGHVILDAHTVFGVYTPRQARPQFLLAPLLNENHLAGHLALGFPLCLSLARSSERLEGRVLWYAAAFATFASGLLTLSRGGIGALLAGGAAYLAFELLSRNTRKNTRAALAAVAATMACMGLCVFFAIDLIAKQFSSDERPLRKLELAFELTELVGKHPWVGVGRGALGDVSAQVILRNRRALFAENVVVQWALEWGVPAALLIAVLFGCSFLKLRPVQRAERALACGFFALLLQNLVDFSLELAGVACVAAIALGVLVSREEPPKHGRWAGLMRARQVTLGSATAALLCIAISAPWQTVWARSNLERDLAGKITASAPAVDIEPLLRRALTSYPLDPTFLVLGTALAVRENAANTPRWLNLAFDAAPGWAGPHLQAAAYLERNGRLDQAALELGLAVALNPSQHLSSCEFLRRHPFPQLVWTITPVGAPNEQRLREAMADCLLQDQRWAESEQAHLQLLERFPQSEHAHWRLVMTARQLGQPELELSRANNMFRALPRSPLTVATLAEVLSVRGQPREALQLIDATASPIRESQAVLLAEATAAAHLKDGARLQRALEQALSLYGTTAQTRAGLLLFASERLTITGNHLAALSRAQAAYDLSGSPSSLEIAHRAALRAGSLSAALRTAAELCNVGYRGRTFCGHVTPPENTSP